MLAWNLLYKLTVDNRNSVKKIGSPVVTFERDKIMNEALRILWYVANGLLLVAASGITIKRIMTNIRKAEESSELSEASSFMNTPV